MAALSAQLTSENSAKEKWTSLCKYLFLIYLRLTVSSDKSKKFSLKYFIYLTAWNLQAEDYVHTHAFVLSLQLKKI